MILFFKLLFFVFYSFSAGPENLILKIGQTQSINVNTKEKIYIENRIVSAKKKGSHLYLTGLKPGQSQVSIGLKSWTLFVLNPNEVTAIKDFSNLFKSHPNLTLIPSPQGFIILGEIFGIEDLKQLILWKKNFKPHVEWQIQYPKFLKPELENFLSAYFNFNIELSDRNIFPFILNSYPKKELRNKFDELGFLFNKKNSSEALGYLKLYFAEIKKSKLEQLSPILINSHSLQNLSATKLLNPVYNHIDDNLFSSIGSQTQILLFPDQNSKIHSGGEFPILNQSFRRSDVTWKQFGLFIDVLGQELGQNLASLDLHFKLSMIANTNQEGIPSLTTDSWQQKISVEKNKTYILKSGFTKSHIQNHNQSFIFKHIPLLKFLFQGQSKNKSDTEIVLILKLMKEN